MTVLTAKKALRVAKKWVELEDIELSTGDWFNKSKFEREYKVHRHTAKKYAKIYREGGDKAVLKLASKYHKEMIKRIELARMTISDGYKLVDRMWKKEFKGQDKFNQVIRGMGK